MRGDAERQANMLLAVTPDSFIPDDHPIRRIKPIVEGVLARYLKGVMGDDKPDTSVFKKRIDRMAESALQLVRSLD